MAGLDDTDLRILKLLQENAALSSNEVSEAIGLSQSSTWRRITNLESGGAIKRRVSLIDRKVVGLGLMVHVFVRLSEQSESTVSSFKDTVRELPEVVQCHMLMGDIDFILLVVTTDLDSYLGLVREKLSRIPGVSGLDSRVVVEESKDAVGLPLDTLMSLPKGRPDR